ncbi:hypothetical protein ACOSQ3_013866 [Xanthoceras sorbifolium]
MKLNPHAWFWSGRGGIWNLPHPPLSTPKRPSYPACPPETDQTRYPSFSNPKMKTCLSDLSNIRSCMSNCYSVIKKLDGDCSSTEFGSFNNPFFSTLCEAHCANNA